MDTDSFMQICMLVLYVNIIDLHNVEWIKLNKLTSRAFSRAI